MIFRNPLLYEAIDKSRKTLKKRHKKKKKLPAPFEITTRSTADIPPTTPRIGTTVNSTIGPVSVGGIMRHS